MKDPENYYGYDWQTSKQSLHASNTSLWYDCPDIFTATLEKAAKTDLPLTEDEYKLIGIRK